MVNYDKQPNDLRYRLVNLKAWNRENPWIEFTNKHLDNKSRYVVLEIEKEDGTIELRESGVMKEKCFWKITKDGTVTITFQSEDAVKEGPFLGHIYLIHTESEGMKYIFPRISGERIGNRLECNFQISPEMDLNKLEVRGDQYFRQVFILEKKL